MEQAAHLGNLAWNFTERLKEHRHDLCTDCQHEGEELRKEILKVVQPDQGLVIGLGQGSRNHSGSADRAVEMALGGVRAGAVPFMERLRHLAALLALPASDTDFAGAE